MSVIRRPDVLGRRTQRRLAGISGAAWAAAIESVTVGTWFTLVAVESRTAFTALAGLAVLLFGSLLRAGVVASVLDGLGRLTLLRRLLSASALAATWLTWLLLAETVGGWTGLCVAGVALTGLLSLQFSLEQRAIDLHAIPPLSAMVPVPSVRTALLPAVVVAAGATALLGVTWFADWSILLATLSVGSTSTAVDLQPFLAGLLAFGLCSFLAQERRLHQLLGG